MTTTILFITVVAIIKMANSQYYGQPSSIYQPYNFYPSPTTSVSSSMYAMPPAIPANYPPIPPPPPIFTSSPFSSTPSFTTPSQSIPTIAPTTPALTYSPSMFAPMPMLAAPTYAYTPAYPIPTYPSPTTFTTTPIKPPSYAPVSATPPVLNYPANASSKQISATLKSAPTSLLAPKCTPPTAIAYYLTTPLETGKRATKTEKKKENYDLKALPAPTYPCPFCTGFANVPKNSKVAPPPPRSSVLPGILDKIPTIAIPDELKLKDLCKLTPSPLLSDLFERKLSGKLRFDEDLLDGFLTGLGLGKCDDL